MNHIVPIVDFRNPDYYTKLFLSAMRNEQKSGEEYAAYCEGVYKDKLPIEAITTLLISSGKFATEQTASRNARKILLLGGSLINKGVLEDLRAGKISFERALWSVRDPRKVKNSKYVNTFKRFEKKEKDSLENATSHIVRGLYMYWSVQPKKLDDTRKWINDLIELHIKLN